jgi:hypothetical protein
MFTIIACTWTIQHLNIPEQRDDFREKMERDRKRLEFRKKENGRIRRLWYDTRDSTKDFWPGFWWGTQGFWTSLKWMLFTMLAPEFILGKAIGDFATALELKVMMEQYAVEDDVEWGLSHCYFAMMGGFRAIVVTPAAEPFNRLNPDQSNSKQNERHRRGSNNVVECDIEPQMQRIPQEKRVTEAHVHQPSPKGRQDSARKYILSGDDVYDLRAKNRTVSIDKLPAITTAEIHDKGKSNAFTKAVVITQVLWMSVQVIVRSVRGLAISQLELMTTAFSLCAIITYIFLLPKPQGVQVPAPPIELERISRFHNDLIYLRLVILPWVSLDSAVETRVPNDAVEKFNYIYFVGMALGGVIFGAVHLAGWNLSFPTSIDRELWHIASILMTCLLPVAFLPAIWIGIDGDGFGRFLTRFSPPAIKEALVFQLWGFLFGTFYILARFCLLVETFRTLAYLPPSAFVSTWVSEIPNIS